MRNFIPYGKQWVDESDIEAVTSILKSDFLTQGPTIKEFEEEICKLTGAKYCVVVANGTAALHLAILALGIEKNKEGITTPNTFVASANSLVYNNLKPIFADIDEKTYNINPEEIKKRISKSTKVIVAVDFAGQPAKMNNIYELAKSRDIYVVEDAAHAIGSKYENGSYVGSCKYSDITTLSFHPVKIITTGEGGAITTNSKKIYERLKILRTHGITKEPQFLINNPGPWYYEMQHLGFNYRITDIQAALGISQLSKLERFVKRRREIVSAYNKEFVQNKNLITPHECPGLNSAFHLYVLQIEFEKIKKTRTQIMEALKQKGIGTQVHYIPVHTQPFYQEHYDYHWGDFPICEAYYQKTLSIPLFPKMTDEEVRYVIDSINKITA